ncbi:putative membrane protein [Catalinimonas alkaloidigena]|uniref:DUF2306 domain-containing protein n=1 Tax=Catalinimonas alkaloidigena TaxID=1075417 RepID=UPI0024049287|nr:DUF2306 domain-containing protein [Catalinimonas alkaloidigena]MDF9800507.1 putative membrane protein [Catalinimonas alkaloidigena]
MEIFRTICLLLHIAAGFTALVVGVFAFSSPKGGKVHRVSGKIYVMAMLVVAFSSFVLALIRFNPFLFMVGVFTLYMTVSGYRGLAKKQRNQSKKLDWILIVFSAVMAAYMLLKLFTMPGGGLQGFMPVVLVFSLTLFVFIFRDIQIYSGSISMNANKWLLYHIGRISGAYIATFTAFLVTNIETDPVYIAWLLPTVVGSFVIAYFQRKYKLKPRTV